LHSAAPRRIRCTRECARALRPHPAGCCTRGRPPALDAGCVFAPQDYGTISAGLEAGSYADAEAFAADVRLVASNAVAYSPELDNDCNKAARANLAAFETAFLKQGLATDGGEAAKAATAAAKPATRKRKSRA